MIDPQATTTPQTGTIYAPTFYPRGNGPLISVFLHSRGRAEHLARSVDSCHSLAIDKSLIEYIIKVDEDDTETVDLAHRLAAILPVKIINTPRGRGYLSIGEWLTLEAKASSGDWLFFFNDDSRMATEGWDQLLLHTIVSGCWHACVKEITLLVFETNGQKDSNESVCLRRKVFDILGHCSLSPFGDSWVYQVMDIVQSFVRCPFIKVNHLRETVRDKTRDDTSDAFEEGIGTLIGFEPIRKKMEDASRLLAYIEGRHKAAKWLSQPDHSGWWYVKPNKMRGRYLLVLDDGTALNPLGGNEIQPLRAADVKGKWTST